MAVVFPFSAMIAAAVDQGEVLVERDGVAAMPANVARQMGAWYVALPCAAAGSLSRTVRATLAEGAPRR